MKIKDYEIVRASDDELRSLILATPLEWNHADLEKRKLHNAAADELTRRRKICFAGKIFDY